MAKIDWEQMRSSPATVGAYRIAGVLGKLGSELGEFCFKPMFWYVAENGDDELNFAAGWHLARTIINAFIVGGTAYGPSLKDNFPVPFDAHGILFTLATACLAGAVVDWVGLGLQAAGRNK